MRAILLIIPLLFAIISPPSYSQIELVPAEHEVYSFLKRMQVNGILTDRFTASTLPYDRRVVADLLSSVNEQRELLTSAERNYLSRLMSEFSYELGEERDTRVSLLTEGFKRIRDDREVYLYRYEDTLFVFSANLLMSAESQRWGTNDPQTDWTTLLRGGGKISGTFGNWLGFSLQGLNGYVAGSREAGMRNIEVYRTFKIHEPDSRFYDITRGFIRVRNDWIGVTIGRERLIYGTGPMQSSLIFSDYAPEIDYFGLDIRYSWFSYNFFHGWLLSNIDEIPPKFTVFHRIGLSLFQNKLDIALSEIIIYGNRGVELAYFNPFLFYKSVEHSLQDRDKSMIALELRGAVTEGLELYGELLIDDLSFDKLGNGWWGNQYAFRLGGYFIPRFLLENSMIHLDYVRIQPYVYTHRIPHNKYTHNGFPLGNPLGPNADEWFVRLNYIFNAQIQGDIYMSISRKGNNVSENDMLIRNVGGDINQGFSPGDSQTVRFLDGNLEKLRVMGITVRYELFRQIFLYAGMEWGMRDKVWLDKTISENKLFGRVELNF